MPIGRRAPFPHLSSSFSATSPATRYFRGPQRFHEAEVNMLPHRASILVTLNLHIYLCASRELELALFAHIPAPYEAQRQGALKSTTLPWSRHPIPRRPSQHLGWSLRVKLMIRLGGLFLAGRLLNHNLAALAAGLGMFLAVHLVDAGLAFLGLHAEATYLDDVLLGILAALLVFFLQWRHRLELRRHQRCAVVIDEVNHHIRNALQVIALRTGLDTRSRDELTEIRAASDRIEWVLQELLPGLATEHHQVAHLLSQRREGQKESAESIGARVESRG